MRISDWSSDVCSSDLLLHALAHIELNAIDLAADIVARFTAEALPRGFYDDWLTVADEEGKHYLLLAERLAALGFAYGGLPAHDGLWQAAEEAARSEEHKSELQSLMRISSAVHCLKKTHNKIV